MPNIFIPAGDATLSPGQKERLQFKPVRRVGATPLDDTLFEAKPSLEKALDDFEQATQKCERLRKQQPNERLKKSLFSAVLHNCTHCRTAFAEWDRDEALRDSVSPFRARLSIAMASSYKVLEKCIPLLAPGKDRKLGKSYLSHIGERIELLKVMDERGRDAYEARKQEYLNSAIQR